MKIVTCVSEHTIFIYLLEMLCMILHKKGQLHDIKKVFNEFAAKHFCLKKSSEEKKEIIYGTFKALQSAAKNMRNKKHLIFLEKLFIGFIHSIAKKLVSYWVFEVQSSRTPGTVIRFLIKSWEETFPDNRARLGYENKALAHESLKKRGISRDRHISPREFGEAINSKAYIYIPFFN